MVRTYSSATEAPTSSPGTPNTGTSAGASTGIVSAVAETRDCIVNVMARVEPAVAFIFVLKHFARRVVSRQLYGLYGGGLAGMSQVRTRSEERRGGKECDSTCSYRWSTYL